MKSLVLENDPILQKRGTFFDFQNPQEDATKLKQELRHVSSNSIYL